MEGDTMSKRKPKAKPRPKKVKPVTLGEVIDGGLWAIGQLPTATDHLAVLQALVVKYGHGHTLRAPGADS
jgi:hypothetical protein